MADIRCPVCNKPNPEELEKCQYCGSHLRSAGGTEPLGPIRVGDAPVKKVTAELERTLPKWLRDIRSGKDPNDAADQPSEPAKSIAPEEPESKPVFSTEPRRVSLRPLRKTGELKSTSDELRSKTGELKSPGDGVKAATPPFSGTQDFLAGLSSSKGAEEEDVPDWLASIQQKAERNVQPPAQSPSTQPPPAQPTSEPATLEWQNGAGSEPQPPVVQDSDKFELPFAPSTPPASEWLTDQGNEPEPLISQPPIEPISTGIDDVSKWLHGLDQQVASESVQPAPASPPQSDDLPSWLQESDSETSPPSVKVPPSEAPAKAQAGASSFDETPDWLADMIAEMPDAKPEAPADRSDWLKLLGGSAATEESTSMPPSGASSDTSPAWPGSQPAAQPESIPTEDSKPAKPFDTGSLAGLKKMETASQSLPDWLSSLPGVEESPIPAPPDAVPPETVKPNPPPDTGFPDWISNLAPESQPVSPLAAPSEPAKQAQPTEAELPDWMSNLAPESPSKPAEPSSLIMSQKENPGGGAESVFSMEMPAWLSGLAPSDSSNNSTGERGTNIAPAELPSWVQAMRPVESVISESALGAIEEKSVETGGPLAGLRDVLPAGSGLAAPFKPLAFSSKLQLNEGQQSQVALLENLIASEPVARAVRPLTHVQTARSLRWVIAVVLLLASFIPVLLGTQGIRLAPVGQLLPEGVRSVSDIIAAIPPSAPVLMVFDYEPGFSGEVESAAVPVLGHLMLRGAHIAILSTSPTGPILAERMIAKYHAQYNYQAGDKYVDLGFLAGGPAGISGFASDPMRTLPYNIDGTGAWQTPTLMGVQKLSDFAAVVIITDSADTGRTWVEQAGSYLGNSPLVLVSSAQAEPMLRPYYESGQIKGLVSGLAGGEAYEQNNGIPGLSSRYWDSFSISSLVAGVVILIGSLMSLASSWQTRHMRLPEEDEG
jgi:hypothetical protein